MPTDYTMFIAFLVLWTIALAALWPVVQRVKHPRSKPVGAYLAFVGVFTIVAYGIFAGVTALLAAAGAGDVLYGIIGGVVLIVASFAPAYAIAQTVIRRPPREAPRLE